MHHENIEFKDIIFTHAIVTPFVAPRLIVVWYEGKKLWEAEYNVPYTLIRGQEVALCDCECGRKTIIFAEEREPGKPCWAIANVPDGLILENLFNTKEKIL